MTQLNERQALRGRGVTRRQLLEEIDRPALKELPSEPYEYSEWRVRRVVACFVKRDLKTLRYVIENDDGVLHIASERQLRLCMPKAPGAA